MSTNELTAASVADHSTKRFSKDERIAQRSQRVAAKRGKVALPNLVLSSVVSFQTSGAEHLNRGTLLSKHRQSSAAVASTTPTLSASALFTALQTGLHEKAFSSNEIIEELKHDVELREKQRREKSSNEREKRKQVIDAETKQSEDAVIAIEEHFSALEEKAEKGGTGVDPKSLYSEIAQVYAETVAVCQSKDALISELKAALTSLGSESVDCIKRQSTDMTKMIESLQQQGEEFDAQCQSSLLQLRQAFDNDRRVLISAQDQALSALYEKRKSMEVTQLDSDIARESQSAAALDSLRRRDDEDYYLLKQELENSIAQFSEQLEEMRNLYLFNAEKLNYHSHILFARSASHRATIEHSRQSIRQWREQCSTIAAQAAKQDEQLDKENEALKQEYVSLTTKFKALQEQWACTQTRQAELYRSIHEMHETHVMQAARKLLHAQRIIATQILGFEESNYGSKFDGRDIEVLNVNDLLDTNPSGRELALTQTSITGSIVPGIHTRHSREQVEQVLRLLSEECSFLVDPNHVDRLNFVEDPWASGDSILQACKVEDAEDVDELCALFYTDATDETLNVHPNDATTTIRQFIEKRKADALKSQAGRRTIESGNGSGSLAKSERASAADRALWQALGSTIDSGCEDLWSALDGYLTQYNSLLNQRDVLISETGDMTRENEELKTLLAEYQHASVNDELIIPPVSLVRTHNTQTKQKDKTQITLFNRR